MGETGTGPTKKLRYVYEAMFSLNLALCANLLASGSRLDWAVKVWQPLNRAFRRHPHSYAGYWAAFFGIATVAGGIIFLILRMFSDIHIIQAMLRWFAGASALTLLPFFCIRNVHSSPLQGLPNPSMAIVVLELAAVLISAALFLLSKHRIPKRISALVAIAHFSFWGWIFLGGLYFWLAPAKTVFPVTGLLACLAWVQFVERQPISEVPKGGPAETLPPVCTA